MDEEKILDGSLFIINDIGAAEKIADVKECTTFDDIETDKKETTIGLIDLSKSIEFTINCSRKAKIRFANLFIWGWRAKGPVRHRGLHKAELICLRRKRVCP